MADTYKNPELYICEKFLDLVEKKPFYSIKVKELVEYAGIGRSTFYTYYDSIYAVAQKLEDDFLNGFLSVDTAISVILHADDQAMRKASLFLRENRRCLSLLCGPNGDPSFISKLERQFEQFCFSIWELEGKDTSSDLCRCISSFVASGTLSYFKCMTSSVDNFQEWRKLTDFLVNHLHREILDKYNGE